jgi:hypothetical protein
MEGLLFTGTIRLAGSTSKGIGFLRSNREGGIRRGDKKESKERW